MLDKRQREREREKREGEERGPMVCHCGVRVRVLSDGTDDRVLEDDIRVSGVGCRSVWVSECLGVWVSGRWTVSGRLNDNRVEQYPSVWTIIGLDRSMQTGRLTQPLASCHLVGTTMVNAGHVLVAVGNDETGSDKYAVHVLSCLFSLTPSLSLFLFNYLSLHPSPIARLDCPSHRP